MADTGIPLSLPEPLPDGTTLRAQLFAALQVVNDYVAGLSLDGHTHTASEISDFTEALQDAVAAFFVAGTGITFTYNDASNTFTVVNSLPLTTEQVQDIVGAMAVSGTNATATYDDTAGTLTIAATGDGTGLTQEQVEDIVAALLVQGSNVTLTYNDASGTLTIAASGSGSLDINGLTEETTIADGDFVALYDVSASANRKMTKSNFVAGLSGGGSTDERDVWLFG